MFADLKLAIRQLAKTPGFTAVAVLILALGIASTTSVFTVIDGLLLRGLPVSHPEELTMLWAPPCAATGDNPVDRYPYPVFKRLQDEARSLSGVIAIDGTSRSMVATGVGQSNVIQVRTNGVSGNFFSFLGVPASLGRTLSPDDDRPDAAGRVAVLSHAFWLRQFGGDPNIVGKTVLIDNVQVAIAGVAVAGFSGVEFGSDTDLWLPLQLYPIFNPGTLQQFQGKMADAAFWLRIMARIRPGVETETAVAELNVIFQRELAFAGIPMNAVRNAGLNKIELQPGGAGYIAGREKVTSLLGILMMIVGVVLFIACANVASLILARAAVRQREFALRSALGAGRAQLIRQLMTEGLLLAGAGGALGMLFAHWGTRTLGGYLMDGRLLNLDPDLRVVAFVVAVSSAVGILVGLTPALRFSSLDLVSALKEKAAGVAGGSRQRFNKSLVIAQIALSVCLLAASGLFIRTLENLKNVELGFNREHLLLSHIPFEKGDSAVRRTTISRDLVTALQAIPGVRSASFSWSGGGLMANGSNRGTFFTVIGHTPAPGERPAPAYVAYVGPGFIETLGIPILRGHGIEWADAFPPRTSLGPNLTVAAVINETFARRYYGDANPLGRQVRVPDDESASIMKIKQTVFTIVGVVKDVKELSLRDDKILQLYFPCSSIPASPNDIFVEIRTSADPVALAPAIQTAIHFVSPKRTTPLLGTMDAAIDRSVGLERMIAETAGSFSLFALLMASLGLYGVLAYNVTQRTREIGVRIALGARPGSIISLILGQGLLLTGIGCAAGVIAAMAIGHAIAARLYGISALDPLTLLFTAAVLLLVALVACWLPARRATKVDPMTALRAE